MIINEVECKSLITKSKLPDADYVINPYIGCNHGCVYCYAQFMTRFSGHSGEVWGSFIDVKRNGKIKGTFDDKTILIGSVTDPYNPYEKKYTNTRNILQNLVELNSKANIEILTKSPLVLRDIDLLKQLSDIKVGISLSTCDKNFANLTEPYAASPDQRINTIHELKKSNIPVYLFISPIFPYLSDWKNVVAATDGSVDKVCFENLNLRANYRTTVLQIIREHHSNVYPQFVELYSDKYANKKYWENMSAEIHDYMKGKNYKIYFYHKDIKKK